MTARTFVPLAALVSIVACGPSTKPTTSPDASPPTAIAPDADAVVDEPRADEGRNDDPLAGPGGPTVEPGDGTIAVGGDDKRVAPGDRKPMGSMDKDVIRRVVRSHLDDVKRCYEAGLVHDPTLTGRVAIQFTIGGEGAVTAANVQASEVKDAAVAECIAKRIRTWVFPKPEGGGNVVVTYPFLLEPETSAPPAPAAAQ
ncbi:MAG: AgmX/PglI C-terminal domain-containing protein [Deltaproteobacteria bacterium]|nr:AgmX/PglI C-terminal domain-containing protein [Deltaproteobacteria bacterium]